ncbi:urease accessory protein UreD [Hasllibacter sp. MH4015]|uniref:urease accessory protein UreD n=1 Tax=Hasllibacter sp. MH4015 TaxID=2854029 RepID=UPI001CD43B4F|nr:urease accessory protein UreD [Hasllibacter sp. MH4015]
MFDAAALPSHQRVKGRALARLEDGLLRDLRQEGSAKVMLPRVFGRAPEVVFLNTAGGITGGDRLDYALDVTSGAALGTTQTAERLYRSHGPAGTVTTRLTLGPGAKLAWLPQELILYDGGRLDRRLEIDMAEDADLVMLETLVLGRAAMGERVRDLSLRDWREVRRSGRTVMVEAVRIGTEDLASDSPAGLGGAVALATLTCIAPDAEDRLDRVRAALPRTIRCAASAWDGRLTARFMAHDAHPLRRAVARVAHVLTGAPLPRVWQI